MAGLREQNKALRREAILDATLRLLRQHHPSEITTGQIAELADVSPATVFNLVGTREELLAALGRRVIDNLLDTLAELEQRPSGDPIAAARLVLEQSVSVLTSEPVAYRRVISEIARRHDIHDPARPSPALLLESAMRQAQQRQIVEDGFAPAALAAQIFLSYYAAMLSWANRRVDDAGFLLLARHGLVTVLAASTTEYHRKVFLAELIDLSHDVAATAEPG